MGLGPRPVHLSHTPRVGPDLTLFSILLILLTQVQLGDMKAIYN
jgi:hypothetical protein